MDHSLLPDSPGDLPVVEEMDAELEDGLEEHIPLAELALVFHNYAGVRGGCHGRINSEPFESEPEPGDELTEPQAPTSIVLYCTECGEMTGLVDIGVYEQMVELYAQITCLFEEIEDSVEEIELNG